MTSDIIFKKIVTDSEQKIIDENIIFNSSFPFFVGKAFDDVDQWFFAHVIYAREPFSSKVTNKPNSSLFEFFETITKRTCTENNIDFDHITRCCINCSFENTKYKFSNIHTDANYSHKILLIYLNDLKEKHGHNTTIVYKERNVDPQSRIYSHHEHSEIELESHFNIEAEIHPKKGYGLIFDGDRYHANRMPSGGELRYVCVVNFV